MKPLYKTTPEKPNGVWCQSVTDWVTVGDSSHFDGLVQSTIEDFQRRADEEGVVIANMSQFSTSGLDKFGGAASLLMCITFVVHVVNIEYIERQKNIQRLAGVPSGRNH